MEVHMIDKTFTRNADLESALTEKKYLFSTKKDCRRFQQYIFSLSEKQYKESAAPYLCRDGDTISYLGTLIDLVDRLEQVPCSEDTEDESILTEIMAVSCYRPKLLFSEDSWEKGGHLDATKDFEDCVRSLYRDWDSMIEELSLCQRYIERGTRDLDRPQTRATFTANHEAVEDLKKKLDAIYRSYYFYLQAEGLCNLKEPSVDEGLLIHCCEKTWLLPLSHVILIHDAQYQMMHKGKYGKKCLLDGSGIPLDFQEIAPSHKEKCNKLAYSCASEIRETLYEFLAPALKTDCKAAFSNYFDKEPASKEIISEQQQINFNRVPFYSIPEELWSLIEKKIKIGEVSSTLNAPPFSAPCCYINRIILRNAENLNWTPAEVTILRKYVPELLWGSAAFDKTLETLDLSDDRKREIKALFDPLRTLVNPSEYFSEGNSKYGISDNLLRAAGKVASCLIPARSKENSVKVAWQIYKYFIRFRDLTECAMLLSNTVSVPYRTNQLPDFFWNCQQDLEAHLQKYKKRKYVISLVGLESQNKENEQIYIQVAQDNKYAKLKETLFVQIAGVLRKEDLSWESAKRFIKNRILPAEKANAKGGIQLWDATFQELIRSNCDPGVKSLAQKISVGEKKAICYLLYSRLIKWSIPLLETKVMECLVTHSIHLFRSYFETAKGGNPQCSTVENSSL